MQLDPVAQLISIHPVLQRKPCNRYPRLKGRVDQAFLLDRIKPPLAIAKNLDDSKLP